MLRFFFLCWGLVLSFVFLLNSIVLGANESVLEVTPAAVTLEGNLERAQLLVRRSVSKQVARDGWQDATREVEYVSAHPNVATVNAEGQILALANGETTVTLSWEGQSLTVPITVEGVTDEPHFQFMEDILPILSKSGCNMGPCHASQHGKGGFKLSVFGFNPKEDHLALTRERQQRRINYMVPEDSLFLQKATLRAPHGGGKRMTTDDVDYRILTDWVRQGAPGPAAETSEIVRLQVTPNERVLQPGAEQQLQVIAHFANGKTRDVTAWSKYDSMDEAVVSINDAGVVTITGKGQATTLVRFEGQAEIATFLAPYSESIELADWKSNNFVDELAVKKFIELGLQPSPLADDATFLRRAYLDATGSLPSVEETRRFLASDEPEKRDLVIDELLGFAEGEAGQKHTDAYASYWTLKWADLIRNQSRDLGDQGMWALHNWLLGSFRENQRFDAFVAELVSGKGSIYMNGPANYYKINKNSSDLAESTAQLFLGVRLQCAKCHHHPMEKYSQEDYYSFAAFFARIGTKNSQEFGLFGRESIVMVKSGGEVKHPKTGKVLKPKLLEGAEVDHPLDRRIPLVEWLTSPENPYFAKSVVNRYVGYLLGHGLVEPIDDMRATNPPSNVALMDKLTKSFVENDFNVKELMRTIMKSRLYQLSSQPTAENAPDNRFYSHYKVKRMTAESLLDAIDLATGDQTKFKNLPLGTRAISLPDAEYPNEFLNTFGKPRRASVCECERIPDENLAQALHTLNGETIAKKVSSKEGTLTQLLDSKTPSEEIISELYLTALNRPPRTAEQQACQQFLEQEKHNKQAYEDLFWALLNSKDFLFVH
ncbi:DUF1553 domain-containing protein [Polystyrenella longa]|nr:DUF1553 domain-containing protein [Polystyrenella longa]